MPNLSNSQEWKDCLDYIGRRVKQQSFNTWLKPTRGEPAGNGDFKLHVPNQFVADWIEEHYRELIHESFLEVLGKKTQIIYVISSALEDEEQASLPLELALLETLDQPASQVPPPTPLPLPPAAAPPEAGKKPPAALTRASPASQDPQADPQDRQDTQTLEQSWQRMLSWIRRQNPRLYGLLNSCKSRYVRGDVLVLNFASDVLKNSMEKPDHLEITRQALQHVFQRPMQVQVVVDTVQRDTIPQGAEEDGMVAAALRDLGGEIVDIQ